MRRLRLVNRAAAHLAEARPTLSGLATLVADLVPGWVDACAVALETEPGRLAPVAVAAADADTRDLQAALSTPMARPGSLVAEAWRGLGPRILVDGVALDDRTAGALERLGAAWTITAPIAPAGRPNGCIVLVQTSSSGRVLDSTDLELTAMLARDVTLTLALDAARAPLVAPPAAVPAAGVPRVVDHGALPECVSRTLARGHHVLVGRIAAPEDGGDGLTAAAHEAAEQHLRGDDLVAVTGGIVVCVVADHSGVRAEDRFDRFVEALGRGRRIAVGYAERTPGDTGAGLLARASRDRGRLSRGA